MNPWDGLSYTAHVDHRNVTVPQTGSVYDWQARTALAMLLRRTAHPLRIPSRNA